MTAGSGERRFIIVAPNFHPRTCGIGDHSARLGQELMRRGHDAIVISREPVERNPAALELRAQGAPGRWPMLIADRAAAYIESARPTDVIVQYTPQMWYAGRFGSPALAMLAARARRAGAKVTLIAHEPFVPWYRRPDLFVGAALQRLSFAALVKTCDQVFVTTETRLHYVAPYSRELARPAPGVTRIGANALPVARSAAPPSGFRGGLARPRMGIFSTAGAGKRFDVVLEAFAHVTHELPEAELVLIGDLGPPDMPAVREIRGTIRAHPSRRQIRLTGKLSLPEIADEIAGLDLYFFPMNTGANTRSCTLPVALGSGLPVVAIRGIETDASLFRDGENVVFARDLTGEAFADAALKLLRDRALLARVGEGASRLYAEHLSWPCIVDRLLAVI